MRSTRRTACPSNDSSPGHAPNVPVPSQDLSPLRLTIDRRRAEFADPEFEDRFLRHFLPERNAQLKASLLFSAFFYVAFGVTDLTTLGITPIAWAMVALRVVVGVAALAGYVAVSRNPDSVRVSIRTTCSVLVVGLVVFPILCWYQPSAMAWNLMSFALVLMAVYVNFPNRFVYAVAIGVGASVEFAAMLIVQGSLNPDDVLALVLMLILGNALGYIAASRFHLAQREQFRSSLLLQQLADRDPLTGSYNRRRNTFRYFFCVACCKAACWTPSWPARAATAAPCRRSGAISTTSSASTTATAMRPATRY